MSLCEEELLRKLRSDEKMEHVRMWFINKVIEARAEYCDLSRLEAAFFDSVQFHYERWQRRKLN